MAVQTKTKDKKKAKKKHKKKAKKKVAVNRNVTDTTSAEARARRRREQQANLSASEKLKSNAAVAVAVMAGAVVSIVKFVAASITGSSAMFSEGIHSMVDAINDSLLLVGKRMSQREPDVRHPFGYSSEVYFYSFAVALVIFVLGGGFAIYEGIRSVMEGGRPIENPLINYVVLAIGICFEGFSLSVAVRTVNKERGDMDVFAYIRESKSPTNITVFLEDSAAVLGMLVALVGNIASQITGVHVIDSWASVLIGAIMAIIAVVLLRETRGLLIGEGLSVKEVNDIVFITESDPAVIKCGRVLSLYLGPEDLLMNLDVTFSENLEEGDVLMAIDRIEDEIMDDYPQTTRIFIEAESLNQVYRQRRDRREQFKEYEQEKLMLERRGFLAWRDDADDDKVADADEWRTEHPHTRQSQTTHANTAVAVRDAKSQTTAFGRKKLFSEIPSIGGERIVLNMVVDTDAAELRDLMNNPDVQRFLPSYLFENQRDDVRETIRMFYGELFKNKESLILAIRMRESGELAGLAEFYGLRDPLHKVSIGCRLRECWWGQGIATETTTLMVEYLYNETDIEIITASTMVENDVSAHVLKKAGFIRTARYVEEDWGFGDPTITDKWFC